MLNRWMAEALEIEWKDIDIWPKLLFSLGLLLLSKLLSFGVKLYRIAQRKHDLPFPDIPYTVPNPHWFYGHLQQMGSDVVEGQRTICVTYADPATGISTYWQLHVPVISFLRATDAQRVLRSSCERIHISSVSHHFTRLLGQNSLIMATGKEWRANRTIVHRAFLDEALNDAQTVIVQVSARFVSAVQNSLDQSKGGSLFEMDALDLGKMATLDIFGLAALGHDFGCTANNQLVCSDVMHASDFLTQECTRRCFHQRLNPSSQHYWIPTASNRKHARQVKKLRTLLLEIVQKRRSQIETSKSTNRDTSHSKKPRGDLLDHLLRESINSFGKVNLTDEYLSDFLITLLFGGYETSSLSFANALYLLARHPDAQAKCVDEAKRVLGDKSCDFPPDNFHAVKDLPYCCAVIYESLRLYPPVTAIPRNLTRPMDIQVEGRTVTIPASSRVFLSLWWIHRYEENFARPDEFLPGRWVSQKQDGTWIERPYDPDTPQNNNSDEIPSANRNHMLSFSAGGRSCVGQPFAMKEAPTVLAFFLRSFQAELVDPNYTLHFARSGPNQIPEGGIPMTVKARDGD